MGDSVRSARGTPAVPRERRGRWTAGVSSCAPTRRGRGRATGRPNRRRACTGSCRSNCSTWPSPSRPRSTGTASTACRRAGRTGPREVRARVVYRRRFPEAQSLPPLFADAARPSAARRRGGGAGQAGDGAQSGERHRGRLVTHPAGVTSLWVSLPSGGRQLGVLREVGLVTSRRDGKYVLHSVTPLGLRLLGNRPGTAAEERSRPPPAPAYCASSLRSQSRCAARAAWDSVACGAKPSKPWKPPGHTCSSATPPACQIREA